MLIIQTGLTRGVRAGLAAAAGAATADLLYATIAVVAGLGVTQVIGPLIGPLRLIGGIVLIAIGARGLAGLRSPREVTQSSDAARVVRPHRRTYLELLALTLLNPATVVYFAALTVGLPQLGDLPERVAFARRRVRGITLVAEHPRGVRRRAGPRIRSKAARLDHDLRQPGRDRARLPDTQRRAPATGTVNLKTDPRPSSLSAQIRPPCPSMMCRAMASPRPVPPWPRWRALSTL